MTICIKEMNKEIDVLFDMIVSLPKDGNEETQESRRVLENLRYKLMRQKSEYYAWVEKTRSHYPRRNR